MEISIRAATAADASTAAHIMKSAAAWLQAKNMPLWPPEIFTNDYVLNLIQHHRLVIAHANAEPAGVMVLQKMDDEFWSDRNGDKAYYLHKLCVVREMAGKGIGAALLDWAHQQARRDGMDFLRLDCAPRSSLMAVYHQARFIEIDRVTIPPKITANGQPAPGFTTVRFEKKL